VWISHLHRSFSQGWEHSSERGDKGSAAGFLITIYRENSPWNSLQNGSKG
jgi:hypothetical protein